MKQGLYIIQTAGTTELIPRYANRGSISHVTICNGSASNAATIRLFLDDGTNEVSITENLVIPVGVTLVISEMVSFDNEALALNLHVAGTSPDINVIIK